MQLKKFLGWYVVTALILCGLVFIFNYVVDPFDLNRRFSIPKVNAVKSELLAYGRLFKAYAIRDHQPTVLALGTSRTEFGISMQHPALADTPEKRYNAATLGQNTYETLQYLRHANNIKPLKQVLIGVDFYAFNIYRSVRFDFDTEILALDRPAPLLKIDLHKARYYFSLDTLRAAFRTITHQHVIPSFTPDGAVEPASLEKKRVDAGGHRIEFINSEIAYLYREYLPPPYKKYSFYDAHGKSTFDYFREIIAIARRDNIDLRLFISPCHARQWEIVRVLGLWPKFEDWKRELVKILAQDAAAHPDKAPIPLWDFVGYNEVTTENVPPLRDVKTRMHWYWEASHYKLETGNLVLDRIFGYKDGARRVPEGFGVLLTPQNIEAHLLEIREGQQRYHQTHPADVAEIERLSRTKF